jgi:hypothetical protein
MTAALATLNPAALVTLADCEQRIERALNGFVDMGQALTEIRDGRLYKATHSNFETYCQERWDIGRDYADRMIAAAQVVLTIVSKGLPAPTKESQARALVAVPEPERADVWRETVERTNGKPTAKAVEEVVKERSRPTPVPGPTGAAQSPPADPDMPPAPADLSDDAPNPQEPGPTSEPVVTSTAHPGPDASEAVAPREGGAAVAPTSALARTPEQVEQMVADAERDQAISNARRKAGRLVADVSGLITEIVSGVRYGEPGLITAEMVAGLRAEADRLESYLEGRA